MIWRIPWREVLDTSIEVASKGHADHEKRITRLEKRAINSVG